jgi:hypothetical protein
MPELFDAAEDRELGAEATPDLGNQAQVTAGILEAGYVRMGMHKPLDGFWTDGDARARRIVADVDAEAALLTRAGIECTSAN